MSLDDIQGRLEYEYLDLFLTSHTITTTKFDLIAIR